MFCDKVRGRWTAFCEHRCLWGEYCGLMSNYVESCVKGSRPGVVTNNVCLVGDAHRGRCFSRGIRFCYVV